MSIQTERAIVFANLHVKGDPLILFNIWDAGSAGAIEAAGAKALATGSWSVAAAHGFKDGEALPLDLVLANLRRIVNSVNLPVSVDLESGYGQGGVEVAQTITKAIEAGAIGVNFEDQIIGKTVLYTIDQQCARIAAARHASDAAGVPLFINARTDIYLKVAPADHSEDHLQEAIKRARAYADAGANGFFAPGLRDEQSIQILCEMCKMPVNIMVMSDTPSPKRMAELGVARISYGAGPYIESMNALKAAGQAALSMS